MKIDYHLKNRIKELKDIKIPKEKRKKYIKNTTGICNYFFGQSSITKYSIQQAKEMGLVGKIATQHIENQIQKYQNTLNEISTHQPPEYL